MQAQPTTTAKTAVQANADIKKLKSLWQNYQDHFTVMEQSLNSIKNEENENRKNAKITMYVKQLDHIKNALNHLVLTQVNTNLLRQQIIEHANKYQNVYRLATASKPTSNQINMVQRLNLQTTALYQKMQANAAKLIY